MLDLRPKSVCAVEMTMFVHWTCIIIVAVYQPQHKESRPISQLWDKLGSCD